MTGTLLRHRLNGARLRLEAQLREADRGQLLAPVAASGAMGTAAGRSGKGKEMQRDSCYVQSCQVQHAQFLFLPKKAVVA